MGGKIERGTHGHTDIYVLWGKKGKKREGERERREKKE